MNNRCPDVSDLYRLSCDSALSGIAIADLQGELCRVNPAFIDMWGYDTADQVVGRSVTEFWANPGKAQSVVAKVVETGEWEGELLGEKKDGTTFHARASASLVMNDDDEPVCMMSSFEDVSERIYREQALEEQNRQLEQFASVISHDLRNPLNVAQGRVELAQTEHESEHLSHAATALERAFEIIDDVLTLARGGERVGTVTPVGLAATVESCWQHVSTSEATLVTETTQKIQADESQLKQLLENLLRNAVEHGGVDVTVTVGDLEGGFYVADDGGGIPPEVRERVFEAGYSNKTEGTGFGLNIVKQIAEAHGWDTDVTESAAGGARFEFTGVETISTDR